MTVTPKPIIKPKAKRSSYKGVLIASALLIASTLVMPGLVSVSHVKAIESSKKRAEAYSRAIITAGVVTPAEQSVPVAPIEEASNDADTAPEAPAGDVSNETAKTITHESLGDTLAKTNESNTVLMGSDNTLVAQPKTPQAVNDSASTTATAEAKLKDELSFQGYSEDQISKTIADLQTMGTALTEQANNNKLSVPEDADGQIRMGTQMTLTLPTDGSAGSAELLNQNSVIYSNTDTSTDTVLTALDSQSIETYHVIRDKSAPEVFDYKLGNLPPDALLRLVDAQTVEVYLPVQTYGDETDTYSRPDTVIATFKAPWAHDAAGRSVPISLSIGDNDTIVLHVLHQDGDYLYPIVADPFARWGWFGFMWWGDNWAIDHFSYAVGGVGSVASGIAAVGFGPVGFGVAAAATGLIVSVAGWCKGRNGATFYFYLNPWLGFTPTFAGCSRW